VTGITVEGLLSHDFAGFDALRRKAGPSTALASLRAGRDDRDRCERKRAGLGLRFGRGLFGEGAD